MKTDIQNIRELISKTKKGKYQKHLPKTDNFEIKTFESTYEHIYDIYNIRLQNTKEQGISILGLNELVTKLEQVKINIIKTTIFDNENEKFVIFTDQYYNQFIGFLLFSKIVNEK